MVIYGILRQPIHVHLEFFIKGTLQDDIGALELL